MSENTIEELVHHATSSMLINADWNLNLRIVDLLNNSPKYADEVGENIKKRMKHKTGHVVELCFVLMDTLMKNNACMIPVLGRREFIDEVLKVIQNKQKEFGEAREKALDFVQYYGEAFRDDKKLHFAAALSGLKVKAVSLPPKRGEAYRPPTPLQGSKRGHDVVHEDYREESDEDVIPSQLQVQQSVASESLMTQIEVGKTNAELLKDMLVNLPADEPVQRAVQENELIAAVVPKCREVHQRTVAMIQNMDELFAQPNADRLIEELLNVNSQLSFVLGLYEDAVKKGIRPSINPLNVSGFVENTSDAPSQPKSKKHDKPEKREDPVIAPSGSGAINITLPKKGDKDKDKKGKTKKDKAATHAHPTPVTVSHAQPETLISFDQPVNPVTAVNPQPVNTYNPFVPLVQAPPLTTGHVGTSSQPVKPAFASDDDDFAMLAKRQRPPSQQMTPVNVQPVPSNTVTYNPFVPLIQSNPVSAPVSAVPNTAVPNTAVNATAATPYNPFLSQSPQPSTAQQKKPKFDSIDDMLKDL
eukprot:TRINITY_DN2377_c0_g1_i1.p1 TRINITY_DN2377_c0_g1~~TRINITY_DN2377_c0_g1_i1.p1  ORF type:complete len:530 (+),score=205.31 TRINITY_DN2377_c0_g1_i1:51-1640(+)